MTYPLSPVPWAMATPDGLPPKMTKSALLHKLEDKYPSHMQDELTGQNRVHNDIDDGNGLLQSLTDLQNAFGDLAKRAFTAFPVSKIEHFVTDTYHQGPVKRAKRFRQGSANAIEYLTRVSSTKLLSDLEKTKK